METISSHISHEYLLLIQPDASVTEKIMTEKKTFAAKCNCPSIVYTKPHITLIRFFQYPVSESYFSRCFERFALSVKPFDVCLNGFGHFPSHTVFVNVVTKNDIIELVKGLRKFQSFLKMDKKNTPQFILEPHITLGRRLLPYQYEQGWLEWQHRHFTGRFSVKEYILLRKPKDGKAYRLAGRFPFGGQNTGFSQGNLFG